MKFIIYIKERTGLFLMLMVIGVILSYSGTEHASAQNVYVDDQGFYYTENTDGTFNVAAYQGEGGSVDRLFRLLMECFIRILLLQIFIFRIR